MRLLRILAFAPARSLARSLFLRAPHCSVVAPRIAHAHRGAVRAQCYSAPGTNWTYDSEKFIEHLSDLLAVTTNQVLRALNLRSFSLSLCVSLSVHGPWPTLLGSMHGMPQTLLTA